ncbi:MAG TPA: TRAP transporter substrate-binding protein DctP [Burkholderiaceae bacterium]|jgi:TRAP-type transport system periplasmic protein|nr:TRAP transporter substrate-binding protein DctP [Burkholderiaceae bacterium]
MKHRIASTLVVFAMAWTTSAAAQEVVLRAVTAFQPGTAFSRQFEAFVEKVNAEGKGLVRINLIGGPSAIPPFEVGNAVSGGVVDIANVTAAFYPTLLPEGDALKLAEIPIQQQRKNGAWELINQLHNQKMNVWYLARVGDGTPFHLYLNKPVERADLSGLTLRVTPVYRAFFAALGANNVQTPPGEVYTALQRGVVDGYGWPIQGIFDLGWHEVTKFRVDPGFYNVDVNVLVNLNRWRSMNDQQRAFLTKMAEWLESTNAQNPELNRKEAQRQVDAGIKVIELKGAERDKWISTAREAGWAQIDKVAPQNAKRLRELLTK